MLEAVSTAPRRLPAATTMRLERMEPGARCRLAHQIGGDRPQCALSAPDPEQYGADLRVFTLIQGRSGLVAAARSSSHPDTGPLTCAVYIMTVIGDRICPGQGLGGRGRRLVGWGYRWPLLSAHRP